MQKQHLFSTIRMLLKETLAYIHNEYVVVPADKAPNNIVFICKKALCRMPHPGIRN